MSSFKVIIVGGGLSGALLANGLLNNNIDFMVYERDSTNVNREGYQIRLGDGAQAGFRACLTAQQHEAIMKKLGKSTVAAATGLSLYTTQFRELIDLTSVPNYSKSAGINRVVLRDLLLSSIKDSNRIKYGKAFVNYKTVSSNGADKILVSFADGSSDSCDLLIGADGAHSRVCYSQPPIACVLIMWPDQQANRLEQYRSYRQSLVVCFKKQLALFSNDGTSSQATSESDFSGVKAHDYVLRT